MGAYSQFFTHLFNQGHKLPRSLTPQYNRGYYTCYYPYCLVSACIRAIIHIRPLSFCYDIANLQENRYASF
jgi:hypothetical protein